jgi:hypothetical protein
MGDKSVVFMLRLVESPFTKVIEVAKYSLVAIEILGYSIVYYVFLSGGI